VDGFLSNNWRDGLTVLGITLTVLQSLAVLRRWLSSKEKGSSIRLRFGYLEEVLENPESSPEDKRLIRKTFAISCGVVAVCTIASSLASGSDGDIAHLIQFWASVGIGLVAYFHEAGGLTVLIRYLSSNVEKENRGRLGLVLGVSLIVLFILSCLIVRSYEIYTGSWFSRLILSYAGAYLFLFLIGTISEVGYQVDEWKESKKKERKPGLW